jgi:hypothetical protein
MRHLRFVQMLAVAAVMSVLSLNAWGSTFQVIYNFSGRMAPSLSMRETWRSTPGHHAVS